MLVDPALRQQQSQHSMKLFYTLTSLCWFQQRRSALYDVKAIWLAIYLPRPADPTGDQLSNKNRICNPLKQRLLTCTTARPTWVLKTCSWTHTKPVEAYELLKLNMQRKYETELACILILQQHQEIYDMYRTLRRGLQHLAGLNARQVKNHYFKA